MSFYDCNDYGRGHQGHFQSRPSNMSEHHIEVINELIVSQLGLEPASVGSVSPLSAHEDLPMVQDALWLDQDYLGLGFPENDVAIDPAMNLPHSFLELPSANGRPRSGTETSLQSFHSFNSPYTPELVVSTDCSPLLFGTAVHPDQDANEVISNLDMNDTSDDMNDEEEDEDGNDTPNEAALEVPTMFGREFGSEHEEEPCPSLVSPSVTDFGQSASRDHSQLGLFSQASQLVPSYVLTTSELSEQDAAINNESFQSMLYMYTPRVTNPEDTIAKALNGKRDKPKRTQYRPKRLQSVNKETTLKQKRSKQRVQCQICQTWFSSSFERRRHHTTTHVLMVQKFFCQNPNSMDVCGNNELYLPLDDCDHCRGGKLYRRESSAAAHIRRIHFNKPVDRKDNNRSPRGGNSGGKDPKMGELRSGNWLGVKLFPRDQSSLVQTPMEADADAEGEINFTEIDIQHSY